MPYEITIHSDFIELKHLGDTDIAEVEKARKELSEKLIGHKLTRLLVDATNMTRRLSYIEEYNLLTSHSQVFPFKTKIAILTGKSIITSEDAQRSSMVSDIYAITLKFFTERKAAIDWLRKTK